MLFSQYATERERGGKKLKLSFIDARKAYFLGTPTRKLFVRLPKELGMKPGYVARLDRAMYGTPGAGMLWEIVYTDAVTAAGVVQGAASPAAFATRHGRHPSLPMGAV